MLAVMFTALSALELTPLITLCGDYGDVGDGAAAAAVFRWWVAQCHTLYACVICVHTIVYIYMLQNGRLDMPSVC